MGRIVFCRKYQRDMEGLDTPPYPGAKGRDIFENVSRQAWREWMSHQTMLINEKRLNMMDMTARTYLQEQMEQFLSGKDYDRADGYVAPEDSQDSE